MEKRKSPFEFHNLTNTTRAFAMLFQSDGKLSICNKGYKVHIPQPPQFDKGNCIDAPVG